MKRLLPRLALAALLAIPTLAAIGWWLCRPATPDAFYRAPIDVTAAPGTLLRQEPFERGVPPGARAWRILYTTTRSEGVPALASGIVMVSREPADGPRPVIAWTHGTTGVVPGCAPSVLADPFAHVPAVEPLLARGWAYVATDYVGLGTAGPHPYLIGEGQARSALDAIRAARQLEPAALGEDTVVWGHSQGGHTALWTGILAPTYAPELELLGVCAIAPASDLPRMIEAVAGTPVGRILSSYVLRSYSEAFADVEFGDYASGLTGGLARDMAGRCLSDRRAILSVAQAALLRGSIFQASPTGGAFGRRLAENTPDRPLAQPLFLAQGEQDPLVLPGLQIDFVRARCAAGQAVEYRTYPGRDHLSVVAPDSALIGDLIGWTQDRFDRAPFQSNCEDLGPR